MLDASNNIVEQSNIADEDGDGAIDSSSMCFYSYDNDGDLLSSSCEIDSDLNGTANSIETYTFELDTNGNRVRTTYIDDSDADGIPNERSITETTWQAFEVPLVIVSLEDPISFISFSTNLFPRIYLEPSPSTTLPSIPLTPISIPTFSGLDFLDFITVNDLNDSNLTNLIQP